MHAQREGKDGVPGKSFRRWLNNLVEFAVFNQTAVTDAAGNPLSQPYTWTFTTAP